MTVLQGGFIGGYSHPVYKPALLFAAFLLILLSDLLKYPNKGSFNRFNLIIDGFFAKKSINN